MFNNWLLKGGKKLRFASFADCCGVNTSNSYFKVPVKPGSQNSRNFNNALSLLSQREPGVSKGRKRHVGTEVAVSQCPAEDSSSQAMEGHGR